MRPKRARCRTSANHMWQHVKLHPKWSVPDTAFEAAQQQTRFGGAISRFELRTSIAVPRRNLGLQFLTKYYSGANPDRVFITFDMNGGFSMSERCNRTQKPRETKLVSAFVSMARGSISDHHLQSVQLYFGQSSTVTLQWEPQI